MYIYIYIIYILLYTYMYCISIYTYIHVCVYVYVYDINISKLQFYCKFYRPGSITAAQDVAGHQGWRIQGGPLAESLGSRRGGKWGSLRTIFPFVSPFFDVFSRFLMFFFFRFLMFFSGF